MAEYIWNDTIKYQAWSALYVVSQRSRNIEACVFYRLVSQKELGSGACNMSQQDIMRNI
jgi:hypothetical protein